MFSKIPRAANYNFGQLSAMFTGAPGREPLVENSNTLLVNRTVKQHANEGTI